MESSVGLLACIERSFQERGREIFLEALESLQCSLKIPIEQAPTPNNVIRFARQDTSQGRVI